MATCKGCGAEIIWIRTLAGKSIPCDPVQVPYWEKPKGRGKVVLRSGEVISCELANNQRGPDGVGFVPHWSTCPRAEEFRKGAKEEKNDE